jgi:hypothetical protein
MGGPLNATRQAMTTTRLIVALAVALGTSEVPFAAVQGRSGPPGLPSSTPLSELEIRMIRGGGGGCVGRCVGYRVTIHGNGLVRFADLVDRPPAAPQERTVSIDDVVSLANEFLRARFLEAFDRYDTERLFIRKGDQLFLVGRGGIDGPTWDLSLRLGALTKTVHLSEHYPASLGALRDSVERMGGPQVWTAR